jgi:hypothetical protein
MLMSPVLLVYGVPLVVGIVTDIVHLSGGLIIPVDLIASPVAYLMLRTEPAPAAVQGRKGRLNREAPRWRRALAKVRDATKKRRSTLLPGQYGLVLERPRRLIAWGRRGCGSGFAYEFVAQAGDHPDQLGDFGMF